MPASSPHPGEKSHSRIDPVPGGRHGQAISGLGSIHYSKGRGSAWRQIAALYELLDPDGAPAQVVTLNRAAAEAMVDGPAAGLDLLTTLDGDKWMTGHHRLAAVRAHLHDLAGDAVGYRDAARRTTSVPERRYLESQAARLSS